MPIRQRGLDTDTFDIVRAAVTTNQSISATTSATGTVLINSGSFFVENPGTFEVVTYTPSLVKGTTNVDLELWLDGAPGSGTLLSTISGHLTANATPFLSTVNVTLTGGNHTLRLAGFVDAGTGTFTAGAGTATGNNPPGFFRVRTT